MGKTNQTILIVDDEPMNRKLLRAHLASAGYSVWEVASGPEALKKAEEKPDLILLDVMMPNMNGFEACRRLKVNESTHDIPVIFLSAMHDSQSKVEGLRQGGVDYVSKPFDAAELLARVKTHITLRRQEQELRRYAGELEEMVAERTRQLIHVDRLATLGTFSAGIAHEINSPLTYIGGNAELLQLFWDAARPLLEGHTGEDQTGKVGRGIGKVESYLEAILEGQRRITHTVNSLKTYSRRDGSPRQPCPLLSPVSEAVELLNHRTKKGVAIALSIPPEIHILCDRQQISQVFINLFNNALDAMVDATGHISVTAGCAEGRVQIQVSDSGPGIPEAMAEAVFNPFFTTKGEGGGTGLGLYIVRQIIEEHGGKIALASHDGMGAIFLIELPLG